MNDKKLRKISKKELLEILLEKAKRIEQLEMELAKTQKKLDSKRIIVEESGSLAEASLKLNNIFEVAQQSAEQYLFNVKEKCKKIENDTKKECQLQKEHMLKETEKLCEQKKLEADEYFASISKKAKELKKDIEKKSSTSSQKGKRTTSGKKIVKTSKQEATEKIIVN